MRQWTSSAELADELCPPMEGVCRHASGSLIPLGPQGEQGTLRERSMHMGGMCMKACKWTQDESMHMDGPFLREQSSPSEGAVVATPRWIAPYSQGVSPVW